MYTIASAAQILGVAEKTVFRWIKEDGLQVKRQEWDRKRVYLTEEDLAVLTDKHRTLHAESEPGRNAPDLTGLYSMEDAARILGVEVPTVKRWIRNDKIEKILVTTDKKRVYVSYDGLITLANLHNRLISYESEAVGTGLDPVRDQEGGTATEKKLYTLLDAAQLLDVSEQTMRKWLLIYDIQGQKVESDPSHLYITHSDLQLLASKNPREGQYPAGLATDIGEIKSTLKEIEAAIVSLEKYIKRSVYLGK